MRAAIRKPTSGAREWNYDANVLCLSLQNDLGTDGRGAPRGVVSSPPQRPSRAYRAMIEDLRARQGIQSEPNP